MEPNRAPTIRRRHYCIRPLVDLDGVLTDIISECHHIELTHSQHTNDGRKLERIINSGTPCGGDHVLLVVPLS